MAIRSVKDPLLAIEFLSLTFACASRPATTLVDGSESDESEEGDTSMPWTSTTMQPDTEDTDVEEYTTSNWSLDGYGYDTYFHCDNWLQDCPEGEKCVPVVDRKGHYLPTVCVPVTGDKQTGEPCTLTDPESGHDDCDATSMCWYVEDGNGVCVPFCSGTADNLMCPDELMCFTTPMDWSLFVCVPSCDPLLQDCIDGQACHWAYSGFGCSPSNDVPPPEPCMANPYDCAAGSICVVAEALGDPCVADTCCAAYCDITFPEICAEGTVCTSFWEEGEEPLSPELANLGLCLAP